MYKILHIPTAFYIVESPYMASKYNGTAIEKYCKDNIHIGFGDICFKKQKDAQRYIKNARYYLINEGDNKIYVWNSGEPPYTARM